MISSVEEDKDRVVAFSLATNVDCGLHIIRPFSNFVSVGIVEQNKNIIEETKPAVTFTNAFRGAESSCLIGELAKLIAQNGYNIGEKKLFAWMRENGYLGKHGERYNVPNQKYVEQGLFVIKKGVRSGNNGVLHTTLTTKITGKGQVYFVNKFLNSFSI